MSLAKRRGLMVWQMAPIPAMLYLYAVSASSLLHPSPSMRVREPDVGTLSSLADADHQSVC